jgi:hypothetical protein
MGNPVLVNYAQFTITDDGPVMYNGNPIAGVDDVVDFVIGECSYADADIVFDWIPAPPAQIGLVGEFNHWGNIGPDWFLTQDGGNPNLWTTTITFTAADNMYGEEDPIIIEVKFRSNQLWFVNWGENAFPSGTAYQGGPNIPVPLTSDPITFDVTFNSLSGEFAFAEQVP